MKIRQIIREYFSFTRGERIGLVVLISLILVFIVANQVLSYFESPGEADTKLFEQLLAELKNTEASNADELQLFDFDPNLIDSLALDSLLLPVKVKRNILKYRAKGGHFYSKDDVRKIYGMNDSLFSAIEGYLKIASAKSRKVPSSVIKNPSATTPTAAIIEERVEPASSYFAKIEINSATADDFKRLNGIGEVLSGRIVKYRKLLGGFYSVDQLTEVYGLPQETVSKIESQLEVDTFSIRQININFASVTDLAAHPYLKWEQANKIQQLKDRRGFINDLDVLLADSVLEKQIFQKIRPYLRTKN